MDYLPRTVDAALREAVQALPIVILEGARATGKTTSAIRITSSELRFPRDLALFQSDPIGVLEGLKTPALIDEWQLAGIELLWSLKQLVDERPGPGQFILTGSVEPETYGETYPLTGRSGRIVMRPFCQRELGGEGAGVSWLSRVISGELLQPSGGKADRSVPERMLRSGFPATRSLDDPTRWLRSYAASVTERSVDERRDPERVATVLRVLAEMESNTVPDERLWEAADVNRETFLRYDRMLKRTHVVAPLPAWRTNRLKRLTMYPKRMLVDAGLALAVAGIKEEALKGSPELAGRYFESFVAAQLRPETDELEVELFHLRTKAEQREIDLLIDVQGRLIAIKAKSGTRPTPSDGKHLRWLREELGDQVIATVVVHRGGDTFNMGGDVWAVPVHTFWS